MTQLELARQALDHAPDQALSHLASALATDPSCDAAVSLADDLISRNHWLMPCVEIHHQLAVDHLHLASPDSLWLSVSSEQESAVRWNLTSLTIENVLFPQPTHGTRAMRFDPPAKHVIVDRGPTALLCNATTLKPIRNLGPLPPSLPPDATLAFSADGLLVAHPSLDPDHSLRWILRDSNTGEILRTSDASPATTPAPLAACLNRTQLVVLHADGSLLEMPVNPVEPTSIIPPPAPVRLIHARFLADGKSALTLDDRGPNQPPSSSVIHIDHHDNTRPTPNDLLENFPWTTHPGVWNGLLKDNQLPPIAVTGNTATFPACQFSPLHMRAPVRAVSLASNQLAAADDTGTVIIFQILPQPNQSNIPRHPKLIAPEDVKAFSDFAIAITGLHHDPATGKLLDSTIHDRYAALQRCDLTALTRIFPDLDFHSLIESLQSLHPRTPAATAMVPLWDRLARADRHGKSWPILLAQSSHLADTPWHRELTRAVQAQLTGTPPDAKISPWFAATTIDRAFQTNHPDTIIAAIRQAGASGPMAAKALEHSLTSNHPEWIAACLELATDLPPFLRQLSLSRIAWLEHRHADALAVWPETLPELADIRAREDWDGWEQADFSAAYQEIHRAINNQLAAISLPENATAEQRADIAQRLTNPETCKALGRPRFAKACLKAALAFSAYKQEKETTFQLAALARELGEAPEPCLRAEALALTAMSDFAGAHQRWIELITEHPLNTQQPSDYAEAAYTAFENSDPSQAMTILTTGLHRFPNDPEFALKAGWIALLTGHADRAYRFLINARDIGIPNEKLENATAMLAIAAAQSGATEDAAAFYQDLIAIDPAWKTPTAIDALDWPDELKSTLKELVP